MKKSNPFVPKNKANLYKASPIYENDEWTNVFLPKSAIFRKVDTVAKKHWPYFSIVGFSMVIMLLFVLRLFNLQLVHGERYQGLANGNRLHEKTLYAQRGRILDRNGIVLADNVASFQIVALPNLLPEDFSASSSTIKKVADIAGMQPQDIYGLVANTRHKNEPVLIRDHLDYDQALVAEHALLGTKGFSVEAISVREYKRDSSLAHVIGYVGRVSEDDIASNPSLPKVGFVGKTGIEYEYDSVIRGKDGVIQTEVDANGAPLAELSRLSPHSGEDVYLTLDYNLQKSLSKAIERQMKKANVDRASGVALHPETGEVLAMVSIPYYDHNLFSKGISTSQYSTVISDRKEPLTNKAISASYPSGSIIKPMHVSAALEEKVVDENTIINDRGSIVVHSVYDPSASFTFFGWNHAGLGPMNARSAVAMSSDIYFYTTGGGYENFKGLGIDRLSKYYKEFGLGSATGIDLPGETNGLVPDPAWKERVKGEDWFVGDTYNVSIGQGDLLVSPLQMAVATATVVNGGSVIKPYLNSGKYQKPEIINSSFISKENLKIAREGMLQVIGGTTATSTFAKVPVKVAGKSGTAETDPNTNRRSHAWYTAFAPYDNPEIVFSVLLEEGEGGSQFAAPAIAEAMEEYFKR